MVGGDFSSTQLTTSLTGTQANIYIQVSSVHLRRVETAEVLDFVRGMD